MKTGHQIRECGSRIFSVDWKEFFQIEHDAKSNSICVSTWREMKKSLKLNRFHVRESRFSIMHAPKDFDSLLELFDLWNYVRSIFTDAEFSRLETFYNNLILRHRAHNQHKKNSGHSVSKKQVGHQKRFRRS